MALTTVSHGVARFDQLADTCKGFEKEIGSLSHAKHQAQLKTLQLTTERDQGR